MQVAEIKQKAEAVFKTHGVARASVFGSVARGTASEKSDVDLLVAFSRPKGMIAYSRLVDDLASALGREVDVLTEESINPHLRPHIMKDVQIIYEN
jgi:hypothetical protein